MNFLKKIVVGLAVSLFVFPVAANTFEVDGLHYLTIDDKEGEVEITFQKAADDNYEHCTNLALPEEVVFEEITYKVTRIGKAAFAYAKNLSAVSIPSTVTSIEPNAFYSCANLKTIRFSKNITSIGKMAFAYSGVEEINLPAGVTTLGDFAFAYCQRLARVSIPKSITKFGSNSFKDCTALEKIQFANGLSVIGDYAFSGCKNLRVVVLPDGLKRPNVGAFADCTSLQDITLSKDQQDLGVSVFDGCTSLASIHIPSQSTYMKSTPDGVLLSVDGKSLFYYPKGRHDATYTLPKDIEAIGIGAFAANEYLTQVTVPSNVKEIGENAFAGCPALKSIVMEEGVQIIRTGAFANCKLLVGIEIPKSVWKIERGAFDGCGDYNNKRNWKSHVLYIGDCMIGRAEGQQKRGAMTVRPGTRLIADRAMEGAYIVELIMSKGVEIVGERAFANCPMLATITMTPSIISIAKQAFDSTAYFNNDKNWKNGVLYLDKFLLRADPELNDRVKLKNVQLIADEAFADCTDLTSVKINDATMYIGKRAFLNCVSLTEINVPKKIVAISEDAFEGATSADMDQFIEAAKVNNPHFHVTVE